MMKKSWKKTVKFRFGKDFLQKTLGIPENDIEEHSHQSYMKNRSKPGSEVVHFHHFAIPVSHHCAHGPTPKLYNEIVQNAIRKSLIFIIFDTCFAPKLNKESLKTGFRRRSFSSFPKFVSHQNYIRNRSKPGSEIVHFRDFRHLFLTKAI